MGTLILRIGRKRDRSMKHRISKQWWALVLPLALWLASSSHAASRVVRALDTSMTRGETNRLIIALDAEGDEHFVDWSLSYDTNFLIFLEATLGTDASGATLNVDTSQLANQQVGFSLMLPPDTVFPAGSNSILEIQFRATPGAGLTNTPVVMGSLPIPQRVADTNNLTLTANFADATVSLIGVAVTRWRPTPSPTMPMAEPTRSTSPRTWAALGVR